MPKKKTALTIEERLQQALVPAEEQPYEVPENWVWVRLGSLYEVNPKNKAADELDAAFIPMEKISAGMLSEYSYETQEWCKAKKGHTQFADGDVAFAKISPCFENRKSMMLNNLPNSIGGGTTELIILRNASINQKYTFWLVSDERFIRGGVQTYSGTVGQQRINMDYVRSYPIPLPPLSEQQRIVERIEELFAKLDEAKERLQEVADSFAVRKAAILHKAFTGELTKKHEIEDSIVIRDKLFVERENMVQEKVLKRVKIKPLIRDEYKLQLDKNWVQCKLGEVAFVTKLAGFEYTKYIHLEDTGEIPVVRAQNVRKGYLDTTNLLYISKSVSDALSRSALKEKSVLITFIGAGIGDACVFDENQQYHLAPNVAKVEPFNKSEEKLNVYFLLYYLLSSFGQYEIFKNMKATAQPSLSMETIREIIIPLPSIEEQHEIVRLIDDLLARERATQQAAEQALASIELMKKSILARAFRGELGTNKASEASALELLRQVLAEN